MRLTAFFLILFLLGPDAHGNLTSRNLRALMDVGDYLAESPDWNAEEIELDEQGRRTMDELEAAGNSGFAEGYDDYFEEPAPDLTGCPAPETSALDYWIDAKAKKRKKSRKSSGGNRCVPTKGRILSGCCLMYVRMREGIDKAALPDHAGRVGPALQKLGYCNVIGKHKTAQNAPVGALLVYSGGPSGHIEKKMGQNSYYFGPTNSSPASTWQTKKRRLTGIYVKCGKKK